MNDLEFKQACRTEDFTAAYYLLLFQQVLLDYTIQFLMGGLLIAVRKLIAEKGEQSLPDQTGHNQQQTLRLSDFYTASTAIPHNDCFYVQVGVCTGSSSAPL